MRRQRHLYRPHSHSIALRACFCGSNVESIQVNYSSTPSSKDMRNYSSVPLLVAGEAWEVTCVH